MVWSADLQEKIEFETEGAEFYKPIAIGPEVQKKVLDSLYRQKLAGYLADKPVWTDREDYNPSKVSDKDMSYVEVLGYINGTLSIDKFQFTPTSFFTIPDIDAQLKLLTLKLNIESADIKQENLEEIVKDVANRSAIENVVYGCEIIPTDADAEGYTKVIVTPESPQMIHAYSSKKNYTIKLTKLLDWQQQYAVIDLPEGEALLDFIKLDKFLGKSTD